MHKTLVLIAFAGILAGAASSDARAHVASGEARFRALYKELIETNTTLSAGSCTLAAERMAAHLRAAGLADDYLYVFTAPGHPQEGGLVALYPGRDATARGVLLLAHLDVVEARRGDWTRDPFTLIEQDGKFYARGTVDDKAEAAIGVEENPGVYVSGAVHGLEPGVLCRHGET
jgi:acetylornithine deacetylase/succinyl-diaminopimelate desuccinylase-like protein